MNNSNVIKLNRIMQPNVIPEGKNICVYKLYKDSTVVYVGQSKELKTRLYTHLNKKVDYDSFSFVSCTEDEVDELEAHTIILFNCELNKNIPRSKKYPPISVYKKEIRKAVTIRFEKFFKELNIAPEIVFSRDGIKFKRDYVTGQQLDEHLNIIKNMNILKGE